MNLFGCVSSAAVTALTFPLLLAAVTTALQLVAKSGQHRFPNPSHRNLDTVAIEAPSEAVSRLRGPAASSRFWRFDMTSTSTGPSAYGKATPNTRARAAGPIDAQTVTTEAGPEPDRPPRPRLVDPFGMLTSEAFDALTLWMNIMRNSADHSFKGMNPTEIAGDLRGLAAQCIGWAERLERDSFVGTPPISAPVSIQPAVLRQP